MVILLEWQRTAAADFRRSGAVAMPGEDAGSGARPSSPVGYLGKVQERAASLDCCPWCASKGLHSSLRSYRLNVHETVTLCAEPQCLFPLVSRPLEDVLPTLAAGGRKRKTMSQGENEEDCPEIQVKRLRSEQLHAYAGNTLLDEQCQAELPKEIPYPSRDGLPHRTAAATTGPARRLPDENQPSPFRITPQTDEDVGYSEQVQSLPGEPVGAAQEAVVPPEEPVDAGSSESVNEPVAVLFWKNAHNLCWLDVLLVVLVNCGSLRRRKPQQEPQRAAVWRLLSGYSSACRALPAASLYLDGDVRTQLGAGELLQNLRTAVFELLQPQLRCKLGQTESPVFAMPLLLAADSWAEPLFRTVFRWEFECAECKAVTRERFTNTLPTFTKVVQDWHPMRATHLAPCNACGARYQRRSMKLERVAPVLALHFEEGLPHGDVGALSFTWEGRKRGVAALVQYDRRAQHFVAWICTPNGSWLEFDDLKHPQIMLHPTLPVPPQEMHLLFWEAQEDSGNSGGCSPSGMPPDSLSSPSQVPDRHMTTLADACEDVSVGSVTLLDAFHGLSQDDIITLTLTEVGANAPMDHQVLLDCLPMPDSSTLTPEDPGKNRPHSAESKGDTDKVANFEPASGNAPRTRKNVSKGKGQAAANDAPPLLEAKAQGVCVPTPGGHAPARDSRVPDQSVCETSAVSSSGPPSDRNSRWSYLVSRHIANQRPGTTEPLPAPAHHVQNPPRHSTPVPAKRPPIPKAQVLHMEDSDRLPLKAAETFGAFGAAVRSLPFIPKSSSHSKTGAPCPNDTSALRHKLLKKLKAKKKKLAKLDKLLACRPDSAALVLPGKCEGFLSSDLLLPSPDSSGFMDTLAHGSDGMPETPPPSQTENFLDELLSMTPAATLEDEALKELELLLS